jgi:hypothetical protein
MRYSLISFNGRKFDRGWNTVGGVLSETSMKEYLNLYERFKDSKLTDNTTVYLTPLSSIPNYKFKNYIEENRLNISTARKFDKLDTLIISDKFIKEYYIKKEREIEKYYIIPYDVIVNEFNEYISKDQGWSDIRYLSGYRNKNIKADGYIMSEEQIEESIIFNFKFKSLLKYPSITGYLIMNSHGNKKVVDNYEFFMNLTNIINKYKLDIVFDTHINNEANKDTVIDLDTFKTLFNMLSSEDKDNWSIAREIIANSNFEESKPYILFLFNRFALLRNKSDNKNYRLVHQLIESDYKFSTTYEYDKFITDIVTKYPQYKQTICDCLTIQFNSLFRTDLIKEIQSY